MSKGDVIDTMVRKGQKAEEGEKREMAIQIGEGFAEPYGVREGRQYVLRQRQLLQINQKTLEERKKDNNEELSRRRGDRGERTNSTGMLDSWLSFRKRICSAVICSPPPHT